MTRAAATPPSPGDFWARRKARVAAEDAGEERARETRKATEREAAQAGKTDAELLDELDLPDPDSLGAGDDFSAFMARAVPERLRRRALRRLWISNPALANLDGLLDYGEDFTDSACVIEGMQTAYQVGRGMRGHIEALARQAEAEAEAEARVSVQDATDDAPEAETAAETGDEPAATRAARSDDTADRAAATEAGGDAPVEGPAVTTMPAAVPDSAPDDAPLPRRRMRFTFESCDHTSHGAA